MRREGRPEGRRARAGRLAPERRRWRLQPRTICARAGAFSPTWQRRFPRERRARGPGPRAPFRRALAPPPPGPRRKKAEERGTSPTAPDTGSRRPAFGQRGRKSQRSLVHPRRTPAVRHTLKASLRRLTATSDADVELEQGLPRTAPGYRRPFPQGWGRTSGFDSRARTRFLLA